MKTSEAFNDWAERLGKVSLGPDYYWKTEVAGCASNLSFDHFPAHGIVKCVVFDTNFGQHYVPIVDMILGR